MVGRHPLLTTHLIGSISKVSSVKCNVCHSSNNFYEVTDIFQFGSITPNQILYNFSRVNWERKPEVCAHSISRQAMLNFEIYFYYSFNFLTFVCVFLFSVLFLLNSVNFLRLFIIFHWHFLLFFALIVSYFVLFRALFHVSYRLSLTFSSLQSLTFIH